MFEALEMTQADPDGRLREADEIGGIWRRISRQHLSSGQGCACGFGGGLMLQGADFELDIIEFVIDGAKQAGHTDVEAFIDATARRGGDKYSLPAFIEALGRTGAEALSASGRAFAFQQLRKTLGSMDVAHSRSRFACD
jgi:hypothetical protein